jgi:hypothetical protein
MRPLRFMLTLLCVIAMAGLSDAKKSKCNVKKCRHQIADALQSCGRHDKLCKRIGKRLTLKACRTGDIICGAATTTPTTSTTSTTVIRSDGTPPTCNSSTIIDLPRTFDVVTPNTWAEAMTGFDDRQNNFDSPQYPDGQLPLDKEFGLDAQTSTASAHIEVRPGVIVTKDQSGTVTIEGSSYCQLHEGGYPPPLGDLSDCFLMGGYTIPVSDGDHYGGVVIAALIPSTQRGFCRVKNSEGPTYDLTLNAESTNTVTPPPWANKAESGRFIHYASQGSAHQVDTQIDCEFEGDPNAYFLYGTSGPNGYDPFDIASGDYAGQVGWKILVSPCPLDDADFSLTVATGGGGGGGNPLTTTTTTTRNPPTTTTTTSTTTSTIDCRHTVDLSSHCQIDYDCRLEPAHRAACVNGQCLLCAGSGCSSCP